MAFFRGGIDEGTVAIVNGAVGCFEGAGILPDIDALGGKQRVPVGEAGDAVLGQQPADDTMRHGRKIKRPDGREAAGELLGFAMQAFPFIRHLHECGIGPDFVTSLTAHGNVVFASGPLHILPHGAEMRHPDVHGAVERTPRGFFGRRLFSDEQGHMHAVRFFDFVEKLAPAAHVRISVGVVGFIKIAHDDVAA